MIIANLALCASLATTISYPTHTHGVIFNYHSNFYLAGLLMILDIPQERSLLFIHKHFGDDTCHFPLFNFIQPLPVDWMHVVYLIMFLGVCGIFLGFMFRLSCFSFMITYWYIFLLEKCRWNNHSYLYGLISFMLLLSDANRYW